MDSVINLIQNSFNAVNIAQALIIGFVATMLMGRYSSIIYMSILALVVDQFVTIAFEREVFGKSIGEVGNEMLDGALNLQADQTVLRFVAYMVLISVIYALRSFFRKR